MSYPALTTTLSLLLVAAQSKVGQAGEFEYRVYQVIERLIDLAGWPEERRSDLYSLLVERINEDDPMRVIESKVAWALQMNAGRFHG